MASDTLLVRLKARNPRAGLKAKDYSLRYNKPGSPHHRRWFDFKRPMVWHRVPAEVGEKLRTVCQDPYRPSPLLFDVCTEEEARALDHKARVERERAKAIVEPTVDTAVDMTGSKPASNDGRGDMRPEDLTVASRRREAMEAAGRPQEATEPPVAPPPPPDDDEPEEPEEEPEEANDGPSMAWTRAKLMAYVRGLGVKTTKSMTKADLLEAIGIDPE